MSKGLGDLMKQAQKLQAKMMALQEELAGKTVEATAGGGMVSVVVNGKQEIVSLTIDPEVVDRQEIEMLQDLIIAAVNDGIRRAQQIGAEEMKKLTGGMAIPGLI
ncbi:MAG: YbaB/EbfC family nucleoid-associated protein [Deltaproteobacteria bacterium]|nr:YbaB/EbfC family nucleoid-associated protein [Deltaproteobacteria bacterium]